MPLCDFTCWWRVWRTIIPLWCYRCYCRYLQSPAILSMSRHMKKGRDEQELLQSLNLATRVLSFPVFRKRCHISMYCLANAVWVTLQVLLEDWFKIQNWNLWKNSISLQQALKQEHGQSEGDTKGMKPLWKSASPQPLPHLHYLHSAPVWLSGKVRQWSSKAYLYLGEKDFFYVIFMLFRLTYFNDIFMYFYLAL